MKSEWIQAGFFLISEAVPRPEEQQFLPPRIITASSCIADVYPDSRALTWVKTSPEELAGFREELKLSESEFEDLRSWATHSHASSDLGWPDVFLNLRAAREFNRRFMNAVLGVHLIGLSIPADNAEEFMRLWADYNEKSWKGNLDETGLLKIISRRLPPEDSGVFLGFDVLGAEYEGGFHTFSCFYLARDYVEKLGITFNAHGLIPDQDQALAAAEFSNSNQPDAVPHPWYVMRVDEFDV